MIIVLHGDNHVLSRSRLKQISDKAKDQGTKDLIYLDGEKIALENLKQALEAQSLFSKDKLVIIENLFSRRSSKAKDELLNYINTQKIDVNLVIWDKKKVRVSQLKKLPKKTNIQLFKISPKIFKFLDSFSPKNKKQTLLLLKACLRNESPELVFYLLTRRISDLILVSDSSLEEVKEIHPWVLKKLNQQSKNFSSDQLLKIHSKLYKMDKSIKTGNNVLPLTSMLDLLIANL